MIEFEAKGKFIAEFLKRRRQGFHDCFADLA